MFLDGAVFSRRSMLGLALLGSGSVLAADVPQADEPVPPTALASLPATRRWRLCALFPHIKDAYWLGVNHGMLEEARRLGVQVHWFEAGGYPELQTQRAQLRACAEDGQVDAILLGTVSFGGLTETVRQAAHRKPVLATVNDVAREGIAARVGVDWAEMGRAAGRWLVDHVGPGRERVPIGWFPGPRGAGWVPFVERGFLGAIAGSRVVIEATAHGDTGKAIQRNLVQQMLDEHPTVRFLVGNAPMAEAAVSVLRERGLGGRVGVVSTYFTPDVHRGILRGRVLAAPTDSPVLQGRMSVAQAVDLLEGRPVVRDTGPGVRIVDRHSLGQMALGDSLPPSAFTPQFRFTPTGP